MHIACNNGRGSVGFSFEPDELPTVIFLMDALMTECSHKGISVPPRELICQLQYVADMGKFANLELGFQHREFALTLLEEIATAQEHTGMEEDSTRIRGLLSVLKPSVVSS